jgi:hypothetical protein
MQTPDERQVLRPYRLNFSLHLMQRSQPIARALQRLLGTLGAQTTETPFPQRVWNENLACRM